MSEDGVWVDLIAVADLEPGDVAPVTAQGRYFAVFDGRDGIHVTAARCTHGAADLCDGYFDGRFIECPLHQGLFDTRDGRAIAAPATRDLRVYPTRVIDGRVQVRINRP